MSHYVRVPGEFVKQSTKVTKLKICEIYMRKDSFLRLNRVRQESWPLKTMTAEQKGGLPTMVAVHGTGA